jgi:hypothetical protein
VLPPCEILLALLTLLTGKFTHAMRLSWSGSRRGFRKPYRVIGRTRLTKNTRDRAADGSVRTLAKPPKENRNSLGASSVLGLWPATFRKASKATATVLRAKRREHQLEQGEVTRVAPEEIEETD